MSDKIAEIRDEVDLLVDKLALTGIEVRVGLTAFGRADPIPAVILELTTDIELFKTTLGSLPTDGSIEWDIEGAFHGAVEADWRGHANFILLIGDEPSQARAGQCGGDLAECVENTKIALDWFNVTVFVADVFSAERQELADHTGGRRFDFNEPFSNLVDELEIAVYPTSCKCVDNEPVPLVRNLLECECEPFDHECLNNLPQHCYDIPIIKCFPGEESDCVSIVRCPLLYGDAVEKQSS